MSLMWFTAWLCYNTACGNLTQRVGRNLQITRQFRSTPPYLSGAGCHTCMIPNARQVRECSKDKASLPPVGSGLRGLWAHHPFISCFCLQPWFSLGEHHSLAQLTWVEADPTPVCLRRCCGPGLANQPIWIEQLCQKWTLDPTVAIKLYSKASDTLLTGCFLSVANALCKAILNLNSAMPEMGLSATAANKFLSMSQLIWNRFFHVPPAKKPGLIQILSSPPY